MCGGYFLLSLIKMLININDQWATLFWTTCDRTTKHWKKKTKGIFAHAVACKYSSVALIALPIHTHMHAHHHRHDMRALFYYYLYMFIAPHRPARLWPNISKTIFPLIIWFLYDWPLNAICLKNYIASIIF